MEQASQRASTLLDLGRPQEALAGLATALAQDPDSAPLLCLLARAHLAVGNATYAVSAAEAAIAADPENEWAYRVASVAYEEQGRPADAVQVATRSVALAPNLWLTHTRLALALSANNDQAAALTSANSAVSLEPNEADPHFAIGLITMRSGQSDLAERAFLRVLSIQPQHSAALNNLGKLKLDHGSVLGAAGDLSSSLAANPQSLVARYNVDLIGQRLVRWLHWGLWGSSLILILRTDPVATTGSIPSTQPSDAGVVGVLLFFTTFALSIFGYFANRTYKALPGPLRGSSKLRGKSPS
jgi:tetratricopeptide (TPR) repeat protein